MLWSFPTQNLTSRLENWKWNRKYKTSLRIWSSDTENQRELQYLLEDRTCYLILIEQTFFTSLEILNVNMPRLCTLLSSFLGMYHIHIIVMWVLYISIKKCNNSIQYFLQSAQTSTDAQTLCVKILTHYFIMWNIMKVAIQSTLTLWCFLPTSTSWYSHSFTCKFLFLCMIF
jgi:hypothetical protein